MNEIINMQELRRQQPSHRTEREARRERYRQQIERLRGGEDPFPERIHQRPSTPAQVDAAGGFMPHPAHTMTPPPPLEFVPGDPMPRVIPFTPSVIELLTGHKPA